MGRLEKVTKMQRQHISDKEYDKIFDFWKLEEYFTPSDYPNLQYRVKEDDKEVPFDTYYNEYSIQSLPLERYKAHNEFLLRKKVAVEKLYNRANIYCGCYKVKNFVLKMAEECRLDMEKYADINEMTGEFYIFSVEIDLDGRLTEAGVRISPFFYAVIYMINSKEIHSSIKKEHIETLNKDINEILKQKELEISEFDKLYMIKNILFDKLGISSEEEVGLTRAAEKIFACKGFRCDDDASDFNSFYLDEIEMVHSEYRKNEHVARYVSALFAKDQKVMIDSDIASIQKWTEIDRYPLAKYPSKFSPTLMQQIAINIAISEKDRKEKIFSVNGPPGTGKTTLLKEIIASNVERLAEVLIEYGIESKKFIGHTIESASNSSYTEKYYAIPEDIARYGILVVSNNNGAVENVTLDLPKAHSVSKKNTRTAYFDREENQEVYFSAVADKLLGGEKSAWGLISARMGKKAYVTEVIDSCVFRKKNDDPKRITLDLAKDDNTSWKDVVAKFNSVKKQVLSLKKEIENDQETLASMYRKRDKLERSEEIFKKLLLDEDQNKEMLDEVERKLLNNERATLNYEDEIKYIKMHASFAKKILILLRLGKIGKRVAEKQRQIDNLILVHEKIIHQKISLQEDADKIRKRIDEQKEKIAGLKKSVNKLEELVYGSENSLKKKYKNNLADKEFWENIKASEESQNACPWTFAEFDQAREELFYAALQVRKVFILESPYIRRNMFVYEAYNNGKYTAAERSEIFPHLFNTLSLVIPVVSSTFASVGRFLKHAGNQSLGMLVIDESGQATPQSALGSIYRTKRAVVVGDPLQVEPVVTIPQVLIDMLADTTGISKEYRAIENSVQTFADSMNEFNGKIGKRQVGCPLVVHRRCIEPMFSISNMISYDNRMFNMTNKKEAFLDENEPFLIKKSGWIDVKGPEKEQGNHFVEKQGDMVGCLLDDAMEVYENLFYENDKIFVISPFRTVVESMRRHITCHFEEKGLSKDVITKWTETCVGTVHTFQGKDANEVLFVLGCSSKSTGAMNWVVKKANILNVACTRAKYRIAFIGDMDDWKGKKFFGDFIPTLIDKIER